MTVSKGLIIGVGGALAVGIVAGATVLIMKTVNSENGEKNADSNDFSLSISSDNFEANITEDTYNQSFIYESVYTFEINCNHVEEEQENYKLDITYYLDNSIKVTYSEGKVSLNELFDVEDSIKYLFDVTQNANKFEIGFYDTIEEIVEATLDLDEEIDITFNYKVDQVSLVFSCNKNTINLHGYINQNWYYSFEESQIIF